MPVYTRRGLAANTLQRRARGFLARKSFRTLARVSAKRALVARAYTGGALAAASLAGYGAYRGVKRMRAARARAAKKRRIAYPIKRLKCKKRITLDLDVVGRGTRELFAEKLTDISKGGTADQRAFDVINMRGFRMQMNLVNQYSTEPIKICLAIVHKKTQGSPTTAEFFRNYGDDRSQDFATAKSSLRLTQTPINSDLYDVLYRWTFLLGERINYTGTQAKPTNRPYYKEINKYIPFKRQLRFDNDATNTPEDGEIYLCYWADRLMQAASAGQVANHFLIQTRVIAFFNDAIR